MGNGVILTIRGNFIFTECSVQDRKDSSFFFNTWSWLVLDFCETFCLKSTVALNCFMNYVFSFIYNYLISSIMLCRICFINIWQNSDKSGDVFFYLYKNVRYFYIPVNNDNKFMNVNNEADCLQHIILLKKFGLWHLTGGSTVLLYEIVLTACGWQKSFFKNFDFHSF